MIGQGKGYCEVARGQVNPLGLQKRSQELSKSKARKPRRKRELVILPEEIREQDGSLQQVVVMVIFKSFYHTKVAEYS